MSPNLADASIPFFFLKLVILRTAPLTKIKIKAGAYGTAVYILDFDC